MRRSEWLQELRKLRFEEAYGGWQGGRLTLMGVASLLGVSDRTFRHYLGRHEEHGRSTRQPPRSLVKPWRGETFESFAVARAAVYQENQRTKPGLRRVTDSMCFCAP